MLALLPTPAPVAALAATHTNVFNPLAVLVLCVFAAFGTVLLLPGRRETSYRKIGGLVLLSVMLIIAALIIRKAGDWGLADVYFWVFSALAVFSAVRVISHPRPVYSALYFVLTVFASAGLFILLWAEFMAAALILIYAGAILVTYVFVIMLASQATAGATAEAAEGAEYDLTSREPVLASATGFALMGVLLFAIFEKGDPQDGTHLAAARPGDAPKLLLAAAPDAQALPATVPALTTAPPREQQQGQTRQLGQYLFTQQVVTLELAGLILTIAMVGAVIVARRYFAGQPAVHGDVVSAGAEPSDVVSSMDAPPDVTSDDPHSIPVYGTRNPQAKQFPER